MNRKTVEIRGDKVILKSGSKTVAVWVEDDKGKEVISINRDNDNVKLGKAKTFQNISVKVVDKTSQTTKKVSVEPKKRKSLTDEQVFEIIDLHVQNPELTSAQIAKAVKAATMQVAGVIAHHTRGTYES